MTCRAPFTPLPATYPGRMRKNGGKIKKLLIIAFFFFIFVYNLAMKIMPYSGGMA
jgi:hypothetical protein